MMKNSIGIPSQISNPKAGVDQYSLNPARCLSQLHYSWAEQNSRSQLLTSEFLIILKSTFDEMNSMQVEHS